MKKIIKHNVRNLLMAIGAVVVLVFTFRLLFVRVVNYEIAGIKIPSEYNVITGKVTPIMNYKGRTDLPVVESHQAKKIGLSEEQVLMAQFRWALFEDWANARQEYKGWQEDPNIFKKANEEFRKQVKVTSE